MKNIEDLHSEEEREIEDKREEEEDLEEGQEKEDKKQLDKLKELTSDEFSVIAKKLISHKEASDARDSGKDDYDKKSILSEGEARSFSKTIIENLAEIKSVLKNLLSEDILKRVYKALAFDIFEGRSQSSPNNYLWFVDLSNWQNAENKKEFEKSVSDFISSREESYKHYPPDKIAAIELAADDLQSGND